MLLSAAALYLSLALVSVCYARESVIVLQFGLDDDTLIPNAAEEQTRVAAFAPFVRKSLLSLGHKSPMVVTPDALLPLIANEYLVKFPQAVVNIAKENNVRWIAIGKLRKFSFMESWVRLYLIDAHSGAVVAQAEAEVRGHMSDARMTQRTANSLGEQIDAFLQQLTTAQ